jgi:hypothetical protein
VGCVTQVGSRAPASPATRVIAAGWPEDVTGRRSTASAARACRPSTTSPAWASAPASGRSASAAASRACRGCRWAPTAAMPSTASTRSCASASSWCRRASRPTSSPPARASPAPTSTLRRSLATKGRPRHRGEALRALAVRGQERPTAAVALDHDEHPRADTTLEGLGQLKPAFAAMGAMPDGARTARPSTPSRSRSTPTPGRSSTCTPPATRAASSTARPPCSSPARSGACAARPEAARAHPRHGHRRRRAGDHADRARPGVGKALAAPA